MHDSLCGRRILLIDLNNFAFYPTLAVGYLAAALRSAGCHVEVLSPLACGVKGVAHERSGTALGRFQERLFFSTHPLIEMSRDALWTIRSRWQARPHPEVIGSLDNSLEAGIDAILLSAYPQHRATVASISRRAASNNVPVILGGPFFNIPDVVRAWIDIPGLSAIVGGEMDFALPELISQVVRGQDFGTTPGVFLPDGRGGVPAPPLAPLTGLPIPDFSDFPWNRYPNRIIPLMTGRGCGWGACTFCSDVVTANGRSFRSRPVAEVLDELETQAQCYGTENFILLDIMLNSDLSMWRALLDNFQHRVPGARWMATVRVGKTEEDGLSAEKLRTAHDAGLTRLTFGLETGSQRLNDSMARGTTIERMSQCIREGHAAGISMRTSVMCGYPEETSSDIDATCTFLSRHAQYLDEARLARFKILPETAFAQMYEADPTRFSSISPPRWNHIHGYATYRYKPARSQAYRQATSRLLRQIHEINHKPLRAEASDFAGAM